MLKFWKNFKRFFTEVASGGTEAEILQALDEAEEEGIWEYVPLSGPYIDLNYSRNVTAQVAESAVLNCRILYIVGKTVSRSLLILTVHIYIEQNCSNVKLQMNEIFKGL